MMVITHKAILQSPEGHREPRLKADTNFELSSNRSKEAVGLWIVMPYGIYNVFVYLWDSRLF